MPRHRSRLALLLLSLSLSLAACQDAPVGPHALHRLAGGEEWVAVVAPRELPGVQTWVPLLSSATPQGAQALQLVSRLEREAAAAREAGQLRRAEELDREAVRVAVIALDGAPPAALVQQSLSAVDAWCERVRREVEPDRAPSLHRDLEAVEAARTAAAAALTAGDTTTAMLGLAGAAERIRGHAPAAVALRVLGRVEERLTAEGAPRDERALHLLRSAREELVHGDPRRALYRAWYALQLADGKGIQVEPEPLAERCVVPGCGA